jgi:hypothetical protein
MTGLSHTIGSVTLTNAQQQACAWLSERSGTGLWTKNGTLMAGGEIAPIMRSTWNVLRDAGCVEFSSGRVNLLEMGTRFASLRDYYAIPQAREIDLEAPL